MLMETMRREGFEFQVGRPQVVIKTEKAAAQLQWQGADVLTHDDLSANAELLKKEQEAFQLTFAALFEQLIDSEEDPA